MVPEKLKEKWETALARAELLFLADNGGGFPDCLSGSHLTPAARLVLLRRMGFRVAEEYDMPSPESLDWSERWSWARLTNDVAVSLMDGFVSRCR